MSLHTHFYSFPHPLHARSFIRFELPVRAALENTMMDARVLGPPAGHDCFTHYNFCGNFYNFLVETVQLWQIVSFKLFFSHCAGHADL